PQSLSSPPWFSSYLYTARRDLPSFPTRRSSDLDSFTEGLDDPYPDSARFPQGRYRGWADRFAEHLARHVREVRYANLAVRGKLLDRKSTRLNSSHVKISYAVFCLKKKKKQRKDQ